MYRPDALVDVVRGVLVPVSVSVTFAPATTAPVGSVTEPATVPVEVDCAHAGRELPTQTTKSRTRANFTLRMYIVSSDQRLSVATDRAKESLNHFHHVECLHLTNQTGVVEFSVGYINGEI